MRKFTNGNGKKFFLTLLVGLLALGAAATGIAQSARDGAPRHKMTFEQKEAYMQERLNERFDDLDATEAQRAAVKAELTKLRPTLEEIHAQRAAYRAELGEQFFNGKLDEERVHAIIDASSDQNTKLAHLGVDAALRLYDDFTPEQRAQMLTRWKHPVRQIEGSYFIDRGLDHAMEVISATDKQRALAEKQKDAIIASANTLIKGLAPLRSQAVEQLESGEPDAKLLHGNLDRASVLITAFAHDAADSLVLFANTLTDEQRATIRDEMAKRRHHRHH
ncbi:MAG: Spy/CpxP family protein refolding chaperone [Myxococcota bacterium]|nr:Spy/CpxP family protein refolding chaperone [Myxococcota bacterium]